MTIKQLPEDNQRSKDWRIERLGNFTGSRIAELMKGGRKKDEVFGETAKALIYEVMSERELSSQTIGNEEVWQEYLGLTSASTKVMQYGTNNEADALDAFWKRYWDASFVSGEAFKERMMRTGSVPHSTIQNFAASPDAVIYDKETEEVCAIVEVKCPLPKTFIKYRSEIRDAETLKACNEQYYWQMMAEMMVTGAENGFFVTYCPFLRNGLHIEYIGRDDESCKLIEERLKLAEEYIEQLKRYGRGEGK